MNADSRIIVIHYTTQASFKSLLIDRYTVQELIKTNGCLEHKDKYIQKSTTVFYVLENDQKNYKVFV